MSTKSIESLEEQIEQLVRQHVAAVRGSVIAAVSRAFADQPPSASKTPRGGGPRPSRRSRAIGHRRTPEEISELAAGFSRVVEASPGMLIGAISAQLGVASRELAAVVKRLQREDRIRVVGERSQAKYFPAAPQPVS